MAKYDLVSSAMDQFIASVENEAKLYERRYLPRVDKDALQSAIADVYLAMQTKTVDAILKKDPLMALERLVTAASAADYRLKDAKLLRVRLPKTDSVMMTREVCDAIYAYVDAHPIAFRDVSSDVIYDSVSKLTSLCTRGQLPYKLKAERMVLAKKGKHCRIHRDEQTALYTIDADKTFADTVTKKKR